MQQYTCAVECGNEAEARWVTGELQFEQQQLTKMQRGESL